MDFNEMIRKYFNENDFEISDLQVEQFLKFYDFLIEKNKVMNLTGITEMEDVIVKHFLDSVMVLKYADLSGKNIVDIGTGAGFPGIPLAILCPDSKFLLLDSLNKRIKFIDEAVELLGLSNVETIHGRSEELARKSEYREKFDYCLSRAVANLSVLLEYCIPFVKKDGQFISYKSMEFDEEMESSISAQKKLGCKNVKNITFSLVENYGRSFLIFKKLFNTSKKYPRNSGQIKKSPL